ncbi:MAG TPA: HD domain-containing phosphohydrolase [Clostridia bacterium]|nr:HD domain-containing phosphohydrolase [Clostridia bacterium]
MVPLFAFLCSLFLFASLVTVKKDKPLMAFTGLLGAYLMIALGSFLMRFTFFPGPAFWYRLMLVGFCFVPYCYYDVILGYLGLAYRKQRRLFFALSVAVTALILFTNIFVDVPDLSMGEGDWYLKNNFHWPLFLLAALALALLLPPILRLYREGRTSTGKRTGFFAVASGFLILAAGLSAQGLAEHNNFPFATLACIGSAFILYYALCKRRMSQPSQSIGRAVLFLMWAFLLITLVTAAYVPASWLISDYLPRYAAYKEIMLTVLFCVAALCLFLLANRLYELLFLNEKVLRGAKFKEFSLAASKTLDLGNLVNAFSDFLLSALPTVRTFVFLKNAESGRYVCAGRSAMLDRRMEFPSDSRLAEWLKERSDILRFSDFKETSHYGMLNEQETRILGIFDTEFLLPLNADGKLLGFVLLSAKAGRKKFSGEERNLLSSALPVFSIALRNAVLYEEINMEAQRDSLTGLYNRRFFMEKLESDLSRANGGSLSVVLFNLDDFSLYNEFYGSDEGDALLAQFADILKGCIKNGATVARYNCNEFAALLPYTDAAAAEKYAFKVKGKLAEHLAVSSDPTMFLAFSAGICSSPSGAESPAELMKLASHAARRARSDGKNRIVAYSKELFEPEPGKQAHAAILQEYTSTIYALTAAIDAKDHYTFNHSLSVSHYAATLAKTAGMDEETVEAVRQAGLLHDIGKIGIPDEILSKEGKLTDAEFATMRRHVERSVEMIRHLPSLSYVTPLVLGHHERYDGRGYPRAIAGNNIPIGARCLTIADSFDAMISKRSYKNPMPVEAALDEIRVNLGKQFDPGLGNLFIRLVESGELNVVCY